MSTAPYLLGAASTLCFVTGVLVVSYRLTTKRLVPHWSGAPLGLAVVVVATSVCVMIGQLLGLFGLFHREYLVAGSVGLGIVVWGVTRRRALHRCAPPQRAVPLPRWEVGAVALIGLAVCVRAAQGMYSAMVRGIREFDSLHYHLPFAARFVQSGSTRSMHFVSELPLHGFHPANTELLHATGLALLGSDVLSTVSVGAAAGLLVLAAWCIGRDAGVPHLTTAAALLVLATPIMIFQFGSAKNDVAVMAFVVAAVAILVTDRESSGAHVLCGLAAGLAVGTKFTAVPMVAGVFVAFALLVRSWPGVLRWWAAAGAVGSFWMIRNLLHSGNPIGTLDLSLGPLSLPAPDPHWFGAVDYSLGHYLSAPGVLWRTVPPGMEIGLGHSWFVLWAMAIVGGLAGVVQGPRHRVIGAITLLGAVGYVFTPITAYGLDGDPLPPFIAIGVRYASAALALGLISLTLATARQPPWRRLVVGAFALVAVVQLVFSTPELRTPAPSAPVVAGTVAMALAVAIAVVARSRIAVDRGSIVPVGAAVFLAAMALGAGATEAAADRRYREGNERQVALWEWARSVEPARIAVVGLFDHYPLYGDDQTNFVQVLGVPEDHGGYGPLLSCPEWRATMREGTYEFLVVGPWSTFENEINGFRAAARSWAGETPALSPVLETGAVSVFEVVSPIGESGCSSPIPVPEYEPGEPGA